MGKDVRAQSPMDKTPLRRRWVGLSFGITALAIVGKEALEWSSGDPGALDAHSLVGVVLCLVAATGVFASTISSASGKPPGKPVLAVDLDECCCGYLPAFIKFSNATCGTQLDLEDFTSYMFWEVPKAKLADREAATERVYAFHASKYFDQIEPFSDAKIALDVLKERFELHVVTSRQADIEEQTREFVQKHFPGVFTELHFGNHFGKEGKKTSKPDMCAKINAVALIDDSIDYARQCAAAGLPVFLFGRYGWNQSSEPLSPLITRVHTWRMVAQLVTPELIEISRT